MKKIRKKQLAGVVAQALGTGVALSMFAVGAFAQQAQKVEKIEVTGSNIKRVDTETVAPVEIITREQIERTGQPTIADVLRNIPANSGGSFSESFTNSFAPGASGISLRGLGQKTTLVLVNGRRTAGYGFAQNLQDTFVDLNSIPSAAVERVEVLKDGASAVYGSDAIAGVVNVILRKDYKGVQIGGGGGQFEGKNDYRFNLTGGFGDLAKDRYTVFGTFDYYKRDLVMLSDTEFGHTRDMRGYEGGRNFTSLTGAGTWRQLTATNGLTSNHRAISECANAIDGPTAVAMGLIGAPAGNTAWNIAGNTFCAKDFNDQFTALPETERMGFLGRATREFSATTTGYVELGLSRIDTFQKFQSAFFAGTVGLTPTAAGLRPFGYNINFAPGVSGNPFNSNARYQGVLNDMGTRDTDIQSDTMRGLAGLTYTIGKWDFDSAIGYSKNEVESIALNRITLSGTSAALGVTSATQPPVPISTSVTYNLDRPSTNSQAVRDGMLINAPRKSESELTFIDTKASTEIGRLPGGAIGLAIGGEFRQEKLKDSPDARAQAGEILGQGITATDGDRDNTAIYAELSLPFTQMIEGQVAIRHDRYSDYGNSTTPKVGVKVRPHSTLMLRANWGKGFRAPTLPEISPSVATFFTGVIDPLTGQAVNISGVFAGNPDLEAEKSESTTVGLVWEPTRDFSVGVNWYKLEWKNIVGSPSFQSIVNAGGAGVIRDPLTNAIVTVLSNYRNLAQTKTSGVDLDARYSKGTSVGKFTGRMNFSYIDSFEEDGTETVGTNGGTNTMPRTRGTFALDWDHGALSTTAQVNYIHGYYQQLLPASYYTTQAPQYQNGTYGDRVPHYRTLDVFARYQVNKNLRVFASLINAENVKPPYDPGFSGTFLYDFSMYSVLGRQVRVGFTYEM
ncbi:MAG TPA: TonB-dependent receptor [Usitatibacteraceae bacterium]|nr:TonB-dependent receptor [Usitatibacteraceae bacterium]HRA22347.1 TonB-dependent receptor [Usitatibacteraceae bacterium]